MKKVTKAIKLFLLFFILSIFTESYSATWNVSVQNFQFVPSTLNVNTGDTIKWQWVNGDHTTTSLTVPAGALIWDSPINQTTQTYKYVVTVAGNYTYKCTPHFPNMVGSFNASPIGIKPISSKVPENFNLYQNYPNPFNPSTVIKFDVAAGKSEVSNVKMIVYNIYGQEVEELVNEPLTPGSYSVTWNASNFPSGIYFYEMTANNEKLYSRKMILVK
jgi:plastocyanin